MILRVLSCLSAFLVAIAASFAPLPAGPVGPHLMLLDGATIPFRSLEISAGKLRGDGIPPDLSLDDLRHIELPSSTETPAEKPAVIVELHGSGRLQAKGVTIDGDTCQLAWLHGDPLSLPIDLVRAIRFDAQAAHPDFDRALAAPLAEADRVLIKDDEGHLTGITGLVESLSKQQLTIHIGGQERTLPRHKLFGIILAQPTAEERPPRCLVTFRDGSTLGGQTLSLAGNRATLELAGGKPAFAWSAVARVTVRSSRVAYLSDLKPVAQDEQSIVTFPRRWQPDKSVSGKPLTLGGQAFEKGIGVHARSSLTFAADRKWDIFAATIGIDVATGGRGDCIFTVLADGQPLASHRLKGTDPPREIQLSITGRKEVTLLVEPGEGLDLADHADWCDARFIKNRQ